MSFASLYWLIPSGSRNSVTRISPGWIRRKITLFCFHILTSDGMVIYEFFNIIGIAAFPSENKFATAY